MDLEKELPPLVLVDLPTQSGLLFKNSEKNLGVFDAIKGLGYRVIRVSVPSRAKDSVSLLQIPQKYCEDHVNYVVIKIYSIVKLISLNAMTVLILALHF
jgi:hypothetical protein